MKRVCLNRLKNEAQAMVNLVTNLENVTGSNGSAIQDVFDSIFKLCVSETV